LNERLKESQIARWDWWLSKRWKSGKRGDSRSDWSGK